MTNCESCIHKAVCKKYINDGIPPKMRQALIKSGCEDYMPYDVDKQNVTALMLKVQELEKENGWLNRLIDEHNAEYLSESRAVMDYIIKDGDE